MAVKRRIATQKQIDAAKLRMRLEGIEWSETAIDVANGISYRLDHTYKVIIKYPGGNIFHHVKAFRTWGQLLKELDRVDAR